MPPELIALIDKPVLLVAILFLGAVIGIHVEKFVRWESRRKWQRRKNGGQRRGQVKRGPWMPKADPVPAKVPDAADQLRTVMKADFTPQPLLNRSEARLFKAMDKMVLECAARLAGDGAGRLGEILRWEARMPTPASTPSASTC